jgi:hypothetical protein
MSEKKRIGILGGIVVVGVLVCTLWPFNPFPSNQVSWLHEVKGIRFGRHGVVMSEAPLVLGEFKGEEACSLEIALQPDETTGSYTVLSFYTPDNPRQFRVRQWRDSLLISRDFFGEDKKVKAEKFDVDHAFKPGKLLFVTITSGAKGTIVYLNGLQARVLPKFKFAVNYLSGQIVIGTSAVDYQPWPGEIRGLAIYAKDLTPDEVFRNYESWASGDGFLGSVAGAISRYSFGEGAGHEIRNAVSSGPNLEIPRSFSVPHKPMLQSAVKEFEWKLEYLRDVFQNVVGFVPVGFLICAYFGFARNRKIAILYATLAGGLLSFSIEVAQAYIPRRDSGITDIITNTLGTALGAVLARPNLIRALDSLICRLKSGIAAGTMQN